MDFTNYRQRTPPSLIELTGYENAQSALLDSAGSHSTFHTQDWSPASVMTHLTTPDISPDTSRRPSTTVCNGPLLLPKARVQDTIIEPVAEPTGHVRNWSKSSSGFPVAFGPNLRPDMFRRSTSPPDHLISPMSAPSPYDPNLNVEHGLSASRWPSIGHLRSNSASAIPPSHSRHGSSSSIDAAALSRYGYPTYRHSPQPVGGRSMSRTSSAMSHLTPIAMPGGQLPSMSYPSQRRTVSPPAPSSRLSVELDPEPVLETGTLRILDYLTARNPEPAPVQRSVEATRGRDYFWFDVRNLRSWSGFNVNTITNLRGMSELLTIPVNASDLPPPGRINTNLETISQLHDLCTSHYAVKVNAALKIATGSSFAMHSLKNGRQQPEFVSKYESDAEKTFGGVGRARVVGIVKCYEQWNTTMRAESPPQKVKYLQGLSQLHHCMHQHGCRYGFIMTELELLCVRYGGPCNADNNIPLFGFLEVSEPIRLAVERQSVTDDPKMTAGLALWYLHMMARNEPFPGQYHWKLDLSGPPARARAHHMKRDSWMPKPNQSETRQAKTGRGYVWPDEPLSRREAGRTRRKTSKIV